MSEHTLRAFLARILGWTNKDAIEHALRSIELSASYRTALVLLGDHDVVPLAMALHRRIVGADRPFILADPRRANTPATVRGPVNRESGVAAVRAAKGGLAVPAGGSDASRSALDGGADPGAGRPGTDHHLR